jgi:hypothetical protein
MFGVTDVIFSCFKGNKIVVCKIALVQKRLRSTYICNVLPDLDHANGPNNSGIYEAPHTFTPPAVSMPCVPRMFCLDLTLIKRSLYVLPSVAWFSCVHTLASAGIINTFFSVL